MLRAFSILNCPHRARVYLILSQSFNCSTNIHYSVEDSAGNLQALLISEANGLRGDLSSPNFSGLAKTVISKCSYLREFNKGKSCNSFSLKDYLIGLSNARPDIVRRFWRISALRPQDVLKLLLAFESDEEVGVKTVEYVWGIFNWASGQSEGFEHFPQSCKIMATMLARVGLFSEVELLLSRREMQGILLDCKDVFDNLIEGYIRDFELDWAIAVYVRMRKLSLVPSVLSYQALIKHLIELHESELMYNIYDDMIMMGMGMGRSVEEKGIHEHVIRLLCLDGRVQESRDLVKKLANYGIKPSDLVVNAISRGYCAKKDYDDVLNFFVEVGITPEVIIGNEILFSLCRNFGVDQARLFWQKLEELGFCPDEMSFGILIGFCCREWKLKSALFYISEILLRGLKPHVCSYNAIISAMFKEGMWMLSRDVLAEMNDIGVKPESSTFIVLLAGFCRARKFDEVKAIVREMVDHNLVTHSSLEDPLKKAFELLGLDRLGVRIKRDDDKGFSKTEFYDNLGNGLYLDTDLEKFDTTIAEVLDDAMVPDFNSFLIEKCFSHDIKNTLMMVDEMARWGQEMSLTTLSPLLDCLSRSPLSVATMNRHLEFMSKSIYQLDQKTLNMLVQTYSKKGFTFKARTLFDGILRRSCEIENATYTSLLFNSCKKGDLKGFRSLSKLAQKSKWSPEEKPGKALLTYLCRNKWMNEALELFETMLYVATSDISDAFQSLLEELCHRGFTSIAVVLLSEFPNRATVLDPMAYSHVVSGLCLEKRSTEALKLFEMMLSKSLLPPLDIYAQLISQLCRTKNFKKAIELKNICLRNQPSAMLPIHCALIRGFCKSGRVEETNILLKKILLEGLCLDDDVFNSLVEGYCIASNFDKVRELLGFMIRKNFSISVPIYSNIVRLICAKGRFTFAMRLKELLHQVTCLPELVLHNILIFHLSSLQNSSLLDTAIDALQSKGLQFDDVTYNFVARGYILCKDILRSFHYLTTMIKHDLKPSNRTLREVISYLCFNGELQHALNLSQEMESRGWIHSSSIQNNIVRALLSAGKLQQAVEFLHRMASKNLIPNYIQYDYLIEQFCRHGQLDEAVNLLNIMLQKGSYPASTSYEHLIRGFCNAYKLDTALDFYIEMLHRELKLSTNTWDVLVYRLSEFDRVEEAENVLKSAIELGEAPSREAFCAVIARYGAKKNVGKTTELVKLMQQKGYVPDFDTHWSLVSSLSNSNKKDESGSFLSGLLSGFGFAGKIHPQSRKP